MSHDGTGGYDQYKNNFVNRSFPDGDNSWNARLVNESDTDVNGTWYAICAKVS